MPARIIDGNAVAKTIRDEATREVSGLTAQGVRPGLAVVLVGDDPASAVYVRKKGEACEASGIHSVTIRMPATTTQDELLARVKSLNEDDTIHGILVQMPLPRQIDSSTILLAIRPDKDVDGFHPINVGKMLAGDRSGFVPATPAGVQELLVRTGSDVAGKECVIVGRSNIVGKPMAALLMQQGRGANATVTVCNSQTRDLASHTRRAEILIVAAGKPGMVTGDMIRPEAIVIDVGVNRVPDSSTKSGHRLVGDVDFESAREVASMITPVPGGVGPMTIAMLLSNTVRAARQLSGNHR
ncbi:MAG: bifunctional methylenetetrahydrofolate dehydrogenase/methenyltetrahydrofolate cyclohydrolase FolD [Gemmatimonadaceae bacterium]